MYFIGLKNFENLTRWYEKISKRDAVKKGLVNLERHIENIQKFGLPVTVAINHFVLDTDKEVDEVIKFCQQKGVTASISKHWEKGGEGAVDLANNVAELCEKGSDFKFLYDDKISLFKKEIS